MTAAPRPRTTPARLGVALVGAAGTTLTAALAHVAAGGATPAIDVVLLAALVLALVLTRLPARRVPILAFAAGSQLGLHAVLGLGLDAAPLTTGSVSAHAGHHGLAMIIAHAVGAVVGVGLLGRGLELLARAVELVTRLATRARSLLGPVTPDPLLGSARRDVTVVVVARCRLPWARCLPSRGPPLAAATT